MNIPMCSSSGEAADIRRNITSIISDSEYFDKKMGFVDASQLPLCMNTSTIRFKVLEKEKLKGYEEKREAVKQRLAYLATL